MMSTANIPKTKETDAEKHLLQSMIKHGKDIITLIAADGSVKYRSPSYNTILGYDTETMDKQLLFENIHPDDIHVMRNLFTTLSKIPGSTTSAQWRQKHADGSFLWMYGSGTNLLHDPDIQAIVCNFRNITEHITIKKELENINKELNLLINNIEEVAYTAMIDPYRITYMSSSCFKMYGYNAQDFITNQYLWIESIVPEDKHVVEDITIDLQAGRTASHQFRILHKDGTLKWIESNLSPTRDEHGKLLRFDGLNRDITDKKTVEQALLNSEKRFRTLIENSKDGMALSNSDRKFLYISPAIKDITGYEPEELIGQNTFDLFHPEEEVENTSFHSRLINKNDPFAPKILRALHKDGSWRWVELTASNKLDDPAINAIVTNFRDITDKKNAEELLLNSEKRYKALIENNKDGIALTNKDRVFIYLSPSIKNILGYEQEELLGHNAGALYHPDDRPRMNEMVRSVVADKNTVGSALIRILHKDSEYRWVEITASNQFDDPAVNAMLANFRDVTERKKAEEALIYSEQRFKSLTEKNQDVICLSEADGLVSYMSPSIRELLDYEPEDLLGTPAMALMHPDELETNIGHLMWCNDNPGKSMFMTLRLQHKDGSWRWVEATSTSQLHNPAVNAIVSNLRDFTERKKAQDALEDLNQSLEKKVAERTMQLEESNKSLESFSSIAAHDLQAPLRVISGYTSIIKQDYAEVLGESGFKLLDTVIRQTKHMSQLVSDLLTFSRASHTVLKQEIIDLDKLVVEIYGNLQLANKGGTIANIKIHELGSCSGDSGLLRQVLTNLISNAIKYSAKTENPMVEIGRIIKHKETIYYVKDNGAGFEMKSANKLFQVFQRLHSMSDFEGNGIGLALVKNIITRHSGRIWAESEIDKGATFYFTLPE